MKKKIAVLSLFLAAIGVAATITSLGSLPDVSGGVFTQQNHDQINTNTTTANTNFTNVNSQLATLATGTGASQFVSVPLTLAQLQGMYATPVQVLAAQGSGTLIEIQSCALDLIRGSAAFTNGDTVTIGYDTTASVAAAATIASTVFTTFTASHIVSVAGALAVTASTGLLNKGIYITNATQAFATGTGGSAILDCAYRVHSGLS